MFLIITEVIPEHKKQLKQLKRQINSPSPPLPYFSEACIFASLIPQEVSGDLRTGNK